MKKKRKGWLWIPIVLILCGAGAWIYYHFATQPPKEPVYVYNWYMVGMTDYYEYGNDSYGMVSADRVQNVFLSDTQSVTGILVEPGQVVKKGDPLYTYDTSLSNMSIQRQELSIKQMKMTLETYKDELKTIKAYKPITVKPTTKPTATTKPPETGKSPEGVEGKNYMIYSGTGLTEASPRLCWMRSGIAVDETLIEELIGDRMTVYVVFQYSEGNKGNAEITEQYGVCFHRINLNSKPAEPAPTEPTNPTEPPVTEPENPTDPTQVPTDPAEDPTDPTAQTDPTVPEDPTEPPVTEPDPTEPEPTEPEEPKYTFWMTFFTPTKEAVTVKPPADSGTNVNWNSGYTSSEIAEMKAEKEAQIKALEFEIKMAEAEYKIMQREADDGQVCAEFDGVVLDVLDPDYVFMTGEPFIKLSGGGGFYTTGTVSEYALDTVYEGMTVKIMSWDNGMEYEGVITKVGDYPVENQGYYGGSSTVSYYSYEVYIDGTADLRDGTYVQMTLQGAEVQTGTGLYLQSAFILTEGKERFVYVRGEDDLLEKRQIWTGGTMYDYVEILGGVTAENFVAFPYGKTVKEGAPTVDGDWDTLYGY